MRAGRVLVVEDDDSIRALLKAVLGGRGYAVAEAQDGPSALPAARAADPDLVLLDVGLPGMDGFAVLEQLKADPRLRHVPVLMVTAWAEPDLITRALDRGAHDYVRKPFDLAELAARVDAAARADARQDAPASDDARPGATVDPLTGLADRLAATRHLERAIAQASRSGAPLSVVLLDLDHFGAVNDAYGHQTGDAVLRAVAERLEERMRRAGLLGRWRDEEFLVVAPDTDLDGAAVLAEDLRAALAEHRARAGGLPLRVTASLGVAQWAAEAPEALLSRCGHALREAKAAGRDAVRRAAPGGPRVARSA